MAYNNTGLVSDPGRAPGAPSMDTDPGYNRQGWNNQSSQPVYRWDPNKDTGGEIHGSYVPTGEYTPSGADTAINRYRGLGAAASAQRAYQNNYAMANTVNKMGGQERAEQERGLGYMEDVAYGRRSQAEALGRRMQHNAMDANISAASSATGGSLAQAAALHSAANRNSAFIQQSNAEIAANKADEMQRAKEQLAAGLNTVGTGDIQSQYLKQGQAISQMQNEMAQRQLGQQGQLAYEGMGANVNEAMLQAELQHEQTQAGIYQNQLTIDQSQADREQRYRGATIGALGAGAGYAINAYGTPAQQSPPSGGGGGGLSYGGGIYRGDPYGDPNNQYSDVRAKTGVRSLAEAASRRYR